MATVELAPGLPIRNVWVRRLLVPVLFVAAFIFFALYTFPFDDLARRVESEVRAQGGELSIERLRSAGLTGVSAQGVRLKLPGTPGGEPGPEIKLDKLVAKVDVLGLIVRRVGVSYSFEGYGGAGSGHAALAKDARQGILDSLTLNATDLDVQALPLKESSGLEAAGKIAIKADLPKLSPPDQASGTVLVTLRNAVITSGKLMGATLPKLNVNELDLNATIDKGVAKVEKTNARGGDVEASAEGTVRLKPLLTLSQADLKVSFKLADAWLNANPLFRGLLSAVGNARQPDGSYAFTLCGPLSNVQSRPGR